MKRTCNKDINILARVWCVPACSASAYVPQVRAPVCARVSVRLCVCGERLRERRMPFFFFLNSFSPKRDSIIFESV